MDELKKFAQEFETIKNFNYVKSLFKSNKAIKTFKNMLKEKYALLEIIVNSSQKPKFYSIFKINFEDKNELLRLINKYGQSKNASKPNSKDRELIVTAQANCATLINGKYLFKLELSPDDELLYLAIYDQNYNMLEKRPYWSFKKLKAKLHTKSEFIADVRCWNKVENNQEFFKFYDVNYYKLISFELFLKLINAGLIRINLNITYLNGKISSKGAVFEIAQADFYKLYRRM